jgi:hypothetical protein
MQGETQTLLIRVCCGVGHKQVIPSKELDPEGHGWQFVIPSPPVDVYPVGHFGKHVRPSTD